MLNICQLLNLTTQLDNTSLAQPMTKQCFIVFSLCVKRALAIKEKTFQQNMIRSKCRNHFWSQIFINVTGMKHWYVSLYEE